MSLLPIDEQSRLEALGLYELADMQPDPALDDIARLAAQVCNTPVGTVSIVERETISLVGRYGLGVRHTARRSMPCATTIEGEGVYQIPDTRLDPDFAAADMFLGDRTYRFYAGAPVHTPAGSAIGCVCVLDSAPRRLTAAQIDSLEALSHMVTTRLEFTKRMRERHRATYHQQRIEAALTVEKNFVAAVLDTIGALVVVFDTAGRIVRLNRACEVISGYESSDIVGKHAWERLIPEEDVSAYIEGFEAIRKGGYPTTFENFWLAANGTRRRISWTATALLDAQGQVSFIIATGIDVTEQRVAERAIRESEARYRQIVEGSLGLVCTHALDGRMLSINEHGARSLGRSVPDVVGRPLEEFLSPGHEPLMEPYFEALLRTGETQGLMHVSHVSGEERVLAYRNRLIQGMHTESYVLGFAVDITDQVRAEDQLRTLIRQSNSVLESVGDGIYGIDLEGRVTVVNPAAAQMLGYRPEELLGRNMHALIHHTRMDGTPFPEEECPIRGSVTRMETARISGDIFFRKDGTYFPVDYVARPLIETLDANGRASNSGSAGSEQNRAMGVVVAFSDISERNALDRMKDEFISTVSHELRTPLTSLRAALGLVTGGLLHTKPEKVEQMMEIAIANTDRLVRLVNDILDLERIGSGKAELHATTCSARDLFQRATELLSSSATRANVRFLLEPNEVRFWADADRILQTLTNLLSNAIKVSPPASPTPSEVRLTAGWTPTGEVLISVEDHGHGIPADKLQTIFGRFQQVDASDTRAMGGTGLGLAICASIVAQHGGRIWVISQVGEGSTFHFTLPAQPREHLRRI